MNIQELANLLNGREYRNEMTNTEEELAQSWGLVVVFGASDDLTEFRGAINAEVECYRGKDIFIDQDGIYELYMGDECFECKLCERHLKNCRQIKAVFDHEDYTWIYKTEIPHATFDIMEDGEKYCRGIVFKK